MMQGTFSVSSSLCYDDVRSIRDSTKWEVHTVSQLSLRIANKSINATGSSSPNSCKNDPVTEHTNFSSSSRPLELDPSLAAMTRAQLQCNYSTPGGNPPTSSCSAAQASRYFNLQLAGALGALQCAESWRQI